MFILKFLLFIFLATACLFGFGLFRLMNKIQGNTRRFNSRTSQNRNTGRQQYGRNGNTSGNRSRQWEKKKIIPKNEGEYVDFTEE